jgi:hypothetical protein
LISKKPELVKKDPSLTQAPKDKKNLPVSASKSIKSSESKITKKAQKVAQKPYTLPKRVIPKITKPGPKPILFANFEIYYPKLGQDWGIVPSDAVYPWELKIRRTEKDKAFFDDSKVKFPDSPVKNYHYTPLYYGRTKGNQKLENGRYAYVPYLVLVAKEIASLDMPTS